MSAELGINHQEDIVDEYPYSSLLDTPIKNPRQETRIVAKVNGRDVRATVSVNDDGTSVFDHQPTSVELNAALYQKIEPGTHMLPGYEYPATVLPSKTGIFDISRDAVGNTRALAEVYLLGDHYQNGVGEKIPGEMTWSRRVKGSDKEGNPLFEDETRAFVLLSATVFEPGRVNGHLLPWSAMRGEHQEAKRIFNRVTRDEVHMQRMKKIREQVEEYRREMSQTIFQESLTATGD
jgi:hypothetical protein